MRGFAVLGLQGAQSASSVGRGIERYVRGHTETLVRLAAPAIARLDIDPDLPRPGLDEPALTAVPVGWGRPAGFGPLAYHVMSPFEFLALERIWPVWAREPDVALVVTLHDLIPLFFPDRYNTATRDRLRFESRLQMVRQADAVLAISVATADDAIQQLGVAADRVVTVYQDCSPLFRPPDAPRDEVLRGLAGALPGLREGFLLYVGGDDARKNLDGVLEAYARLPEALRSRHQLVLAGGLLEHVRRDALERAARLGVSAGVMLTGRISDEVLRALYQACALFVFASWYEGFGLPVLEAMRCGAPVVAGDASSLRELVPDREARFDPHDPDAIAAVVRRGLTDPAFPPRLRAMGERMRQRFSWAATAERSYAGYELALRRRHAWARRLRRRGDAAANR